MRHNDNLSRTLQKSTISAAEGQCVADMTVRTLQTIRNDSAFDLFWEKTAQDVNKLGITEPSLPRRKRIPRRIDDSSEDNYAYPSTPKEHYRRIYYEALDLMTIHVLQIALISLVIRCIKTWKVFSLNLQMEKGTTMKLKQYCNSIRMTSILSY